MTNLIPALIKAQSEFPPVTKDGKNPHFKNNYATLEQVINCTATALQKNGLAIVQTMEVDSLRTTLYHTSGESITGVQLLHPSKNDPQGWHGAQTYARRYGMLSILGIASEDDDGNTASEKSKSLTESEKSALLDSIDMAESVDILKKNYHSALEKAKAINDKISENMFVDSKNKRYRELTGGAKNG
jgi:hypothetical protein